MPTILPAPRRVRHKARLVDTIWLLASFALAVATFWVALAYLA
jgi:hypothetical protein